MTSTSMFLESSQPTRPNSGRVRPPSLLNGVELGSDDLESELAVLDPGLAVLGERLHHRESSTRLPSSWPSFDDTGSSARSRPRRPAAVLGS